MGKLTENSSPGEYISVLAVAPLADYRLAVRLSNGRTGAYDVTHLLNRGIAKALKAPEYFARVKIFFSGVGWPNGFDISPFAIDDKLQPLRPDEAPPPK